MASIEKINEESKQFANEWRGQLFRNFIAIIFASILFLGFSPGTTFEYLASICLVIPIFLWAHRKPEKIKNRKILYSLCVFASLFIYLGLVNAS